MASFLIRVVLHRDATSKNYQDLHAAMERYGCERSIQGDDGILYDLPDGEYVLESDARYETVRDDVVKIATAVRMDPSVLVTEALRYAWRLYPVPGDS